MASSNETDSSNSPSISPYISDITDEEDGEIKSGGCYLNEPEYNQEELLKIQNTRLHDDEHETSSEEEEDMNSSRLENLHWCTCQNCVIFNTFKLIECKCCQESSILLNDKLDNIQCITLHPDFEILCLNSTVLETAFIRHRRYHRNFKELSTYINK